MKSAKQALEDAKTEPTTEEIHNAEQYYVNNVGQMETASESAYDEAVLEHLAHNFVSPVQSVEQESGDVYYGVIDYVENDVDWYGFFAWDEQSVGNRVVGIREADEATSDNQLPHVSSGDPSGSFPDDPETPFEELAGRVLEYYDDMYENDDPKSEPVPLENRPSDTIPRTKGYATGPNTNRERERERAKKRAPDHSNAGGDGN